MSQSHLLIDFPIRAPGNARVLAEELPPLMPDFAKVQDDLGTVHFSRFMVEGETRSCCSCPTSTASVAAARRAATGRTGLSPVFDGHLRARRSTRRRRAVAG